MHDFTQPVVLYARGMAADRLDEFDVRIQKAFAQDALSHHAGSAEQQDFHARPARRRNPAA
jgi:hypothetical protein